MAVSKEQTHLLRPNWNLTTSQFLISKEEDNAFLLHDHVSKNCPKQKKAGGILSSQTSTEVTPNEHAHLVKSERMTEKNR